MNGLRNVKEVLTLCVSTGIEPKVEEGSLPGNSRTTWKRELAFYSSERDLSPNINNARYV